MGKSGRVLAASKVNVKTISLSNVSATNSKEAV